MSNRGKGWNSLHEFGRYTVMGVILILGNGACVGVGGERIPVMHDSLSTPERQFSDGIVVERPAQDLRSNTSRVGRATITVFAITSGSVKTKDPVTDAVVEQIKDAFEAGGYHVTVADKDHARVANAPIVEVSIEDFYFRNYNWLWPIVPTWGGIELGLTVSQANGTVVYQRSFRGKGSSLCLSGHCAFKAATRQAMTELLNEIAVVSTTQEFRSALATPGGGASRGHSR